MKKEGRTRKEEGNKRKELEKKWIGERRGKEGKGEEETQDGTGEVGGETDIN